MSLYPTHGSPGQEPLQPPTPKPIPMARSTPEEMVTYAQPPNHPSPLPHAHNPSVTHNPCGEGATEEAPLGPIKNEEVDPPRGAMPVDGGSSAQALEHFVPVPHRQESVVIQNPFDKDDNDVKLKKVRSRRSRSTFIEGNCRNTDDQVFE